MCDTRWLNWQLLFSLLTGSIPGIADACVYNATASSYGIPNLSVARPVVKGCEETDQDGEYELHSLPTGLYTVGFWGRGTSAEYVPSYYDGQPTSSGASTVSPGPNTVPFNDTCCGGITRTRIMTSADP